MTEQQIYMLLLVWASFVVGVFAERITAKARIEERLRVEAALRCGKKMYGLEIMRRSGVRAGTLYKILERYEKLGVVRSRFTAAGRRIYWWVGESDG